MLDVSSWFEDSSACIEQSQMTAKDPAVVNRVRNAPGFLNYTRRLLDLVAVPVELAQDLVVVVLHCTDGRQISPIAADELGDLGRAEGWTVKVEHLDLDNQVIRAVTT